MSQSGIAYGTTTTFNNGGSGFLISNGSFTITITDGADSGCTFTVTVNPPEPCAAPIAAINPSGNLTVCSNSPQVMFMDASSNNPTSWSWSIVGPGVSLSNTTGSMTTATFTQGGTFTLTLTATNQYGSDTENSTFTVTYLDETNSQCQSCIYELVMWDRLANQWASNQNVKVTIDGVQTTYTGPPNGSTSSSVTLSVMSNSILEVEASVGNSSNASQMAWRIMDEQGYVVLGDGDVFGMGVVSNQGSNAPNLAPPSGGVVYMDSANCSSVPACANFELSITFDDYPEETAWQILDSNGDYIYQSLGYAGMTSQTLVESLCLPEGCYTLKFFDYYGDGICCNYGNGAYTLTQLSDNAVLASGGTFTGTITHSFCATIEEACPTYLLVSGTIADDDYVTSEYIESDGLVPNGGVVGIYAPDSVNLINNFEVSTGATFIAENLDCTAFETFQNDEGTSMIRIKNAKHSSLISVVDIHGERIPFQEMDPGFYLVSMEELSTVFLMISDRNGNHHYRKVLVGTP